MDEQKTLLSIVPPRCHIMIIGPDGELIAMQGGPVAACGSLASEVIDILSAVCDTSQLSPETLHEFANLKSWEENRIVVQWKR